MRENTGETRVEEAEEGEGEERAVREEEKIPSSTVFLDFDFELCPSLAESGVDCVLAV
jgi:hypothetical protein